MSLDYFRLMKGVEIEKDDLSARVRILLGTGLPGGDAGEQDDAPIGSVFMRTDVASGGAQFYWKSGSINATSDWEIGASKDYVDAAISAVSGGTSWREPVRVIDSTVYANVAAFPVSGTIDSVLLADGDRVLFTNVTTGNDNIYIWDATGSSWLEDPLNPVSDGDAVFVKEGTSADALYFYDGTSWVKYADSNSYAELAFLRTFMGKGAVGSEMPTYSSTEVVTQNGSLEQAVGELDAAMGNGNITNTGGNYSLSSDMTWGSGTNDVTEALDQLNAAVGDRSYSVNNIVTDGQSVAASVEAIDVAIGNRTYTSDNVVTDGQTITASVDALDVAVGVLNDLTLTSTATNVDASVTPVVMDSIPVTEATQVKWLVQVRQNGTPTSKRAMEVHAVTNGTAVDHSKYAVIKVGVSISGFGVNVVINGGNIEITIAATPAIDYVVKRISYTNF